MTVEQLKQIDQDQNNSINAQELRVAIKPNGFLSDDKNIKEVGELLNKTETLDETDKELVNSLKATIDNEINTILERGTATEEDIMLINIRKELLGENDDRVKRLEELFTSQNSETDGNVTEEAPQISEGPTKEEIIMQKYESLADTEILILSTKLHIGTNLIGDIDSFLTTQHENLNFNDQSNLKALNILNELIKEDSERHVKLEKIVSSAILKMSQKINEKIAKNKDGNADYYTEEQKMLIQLWANVCYGESLLIDGFKNRGDKDKKGVKNIWKIDGSNEGRTNLYIYKLEFGTRTDVTNNSKYKDLLNIPNIDEKLEGLTNEAKENIMREFLNFFFNIRQSGLYFENLIGDDQLENVFDCFVNAEVFKDMPMEQFIYMQKELYRWEYYNQKGPKSLVQIHPLTGQEQEISTNESEFDEEEYQSGLKETEENLRAFKSPSEYYLAIANGRIEQIITTLNGNIESNYASSFKEINGYIEELTNLNSQPGNQNDESIQQRKKELYDKIFMSKKYNELPNEVKKSILLMLNSDFKIQEINDVYQTIAKIDKNIQRTYTEDSSKRELKYENEKYYVQLNDNSLHEIDNSTYYNIINIKSGQLKLPGRLTYTYYNNNFLICVAVEEGNYINYKPIQTTYVGNLGTTLLRVPKEELEKFNRYSNLNIGGELKQIIEENNQRYTELEDDIDILNQYNNLKDNEESKLTKDATFEEKDNEKKDNKEFKLTRDVTFEEYEKYWPSDAYANRMGLEGTLQNYSGRGWTKNYQDKTKNDVHVPGDIYRLYVPGCENIVVRITNDNINKIKNLLASKRNRQIVLRDFKAKKSGYTKGLGVSNTGYDIQSVKSSNESQIHILGIEDFAIVEESQNGEVILKDLNGQEIRRINRETQNEISKLENDSRTILKTQEIDGLINYRTGKGDTLLNMKLEIDSLLNQMNQAKINWKNVFQKNLLSFAQGAEGNTYDFTNAINETKTVDNPFTQEQVQKIWETAIEMKNLGEIVKEQKKDWEDLKERLQEIKSRSNNGVSNELEQYIDGLYNGVCNMLEFIKPNGGLDNLSDFVINKENVFAKENASQILWQWIKKNGIVILTSIACAVALICAIPTGGATLSSMPYLATFLSAAGGTLGGMAGSRVGKVFNEGLNNLHREVIIVDGKQYTIRYDSPTDVEMYLSGKLSGQDFWKGLGKEFAIGTASTFGFMVAGQRVGQALSTKYPKIAKKIRPNTFKGSTEYTDNMFNSIINQGEKNDF